MDFKWNSPLCASTPPLRWSDFFLVRSRIPPPQNTPFEDRKSSGWPLSRCFSSIEVHFWHFSRLCPFSIDLTALHFAVLHFHTVLYSSELNLKQIHRIYIYFTESIFLVPNRGSEPYWYGSTVLRSIYTVKLANSTSPSKFRQVKFSLKTGLKNDKMCFSHLSLNTIKQFFWKPQFVILRTSFSGNLTRWNLEGLVELAHLTVCHSSLFFFMRLYYYICTILHDCVLYLQLS